MSNHGFGLDLESNDFWATLREVNQKAKQDKTSYNFVVRPGSNLAVPVTPSEEAEYFNEGEYSARMSEIEGEAESEMLTIETKEELEALLSCLSPGLRTA